MEILAFVSGVLLLLSVQVVEISLKFISESLVKAESRSKGRDG